SHQYAGLPAGTGCRDDHHPVAARAIRSDRFVAMLSPQTPHVLVTTPNPVFDYELRRLRRPSSAASLKHFSRIALFSLSGIVMVVWLLVYVTRNPVPDATTVRPLFW